MDSNMVIPIISGCLCMASYFCGVYMTERSYRKLLKLALKEIKSP